MIHLAMSRGYSLSLVKEAKYRVVVKEFAEEERKRWSRTKQGGIVKFRCVIGTGAGKTYTFDAVSIKGYHEGALFNLRRPEQLLVPHCSQSRKLTIDKP